MRNMEYLQDAREFADAPIRKRFDVLTDWDIVHCFELHGKKKMSR